jgi:hypothetical protein
MTAAASLGFLGVTASAIGTLDLVTSGTAQAGAESSITLADGASGDNDFYNDYYVRITGGTGDAGDIHKITAYNGSTKVATIDGTWTTTPDGTTQYEIVVGDKFFGADINFELRDPVHGDTQVTVDQIIDAIRARMFLFDEMLIPDPVDYSTTEPVTGFIDGSVGGGLGITLKLEPDGAIAGLPVTLGTLSLTAHGDNWLEDVPTPSVDFIAPTGWDDLLDSLRNMSFDNILEVLQLVVNFLRGLDGSDGNGAAAGILGFKIPLIDRSLSELIDIGGEFLDFIDELTANPQGMLQKLETQIKNVLGLPSGTPILAFELDSGTSLPTGVLTFNFDFQRSTSLTRPFNLDLANAGLPSWMTNIVGLSATGNLGVEADIDLSLALGLDLLGGDDLAAFFLDVDETYLAASARAYGSNLDFEAALGPIGLFIIDAEASITGEFGVKLADPNENGRLNLIAFGGSSVSSDLVNLGSFLDTAIHTAGTLRSDYTGAIHHRRLFGILHHRPRNRDPADLLRPEGQPGAPGQHGNHNKRRVRRDGLQHRRK